MPATRETTTKAKDATPKVRRTRARANGEGTIYQRGDTGTWCGSVTLPTGKRKYFYTKTRDEVAKKLRRVLRDLEMGIALADERVTVGAWLAQYLDDLEARGAAHTTVTRYRGILSSYLEPELGRIKLAQLQPQDVQAYQVALLRRGIPAKTITLHRALLGGAIKQAAAYGMVARNVVSLVKPPRRQGETKGKMLSPQDARALMDVIREDRLEAFYLVLLTAGLRRGEALGLRWADLELDEPTGGMLHVRQQLQWPKGKPTLVPVKSRKGVRSIPLPQVTVDVLRARRDMQEGERSFVGEANWTADNLVFNSEEGAPLHRNTITNQFHARLKTAGLGHLRLHDLRHTYGSLLMSQSVPLKTISELMGHASIEVTANIYLHSLDVQVRDTARSVERALAAPDPGEGGRCPTCGQTIQARPA